MYANKLKSFFFIAMIVTAGFIVPVNLAAQPYLDIVKFKYSNSPGSSSKNKNNVKLRYFSFETNIPVQFKNKKDALIFSPYYERWWSQIIYNPKQAHYGIGLPVSLIKSFPKSKWSILVNVIARLNDNSCKRNANLQIGGATIINYKRNENLTWKLGIYVNNEFFGVFVMPLAGIDWKINERNTLFGVLPGNLIYEHKINKWIYYGTCFRAITNSYKNGNGYWRIDENQLGLYLDTYLAKNFVLNVEAGRSVLRKLRTGIKNISTYDTKVNDNLYFRVSLAYRVRFANR